MRSRRSRCALKAVLLLASVGLVGLVNMAPAQNNAFRDGAVATSHNLVDLIALATAEGRCRSDSKHLRNALNQVLHVLDQKEHCKKGSFGKGLSNSGSSNYANGAAPRFGANPATNAAANGFADVQANGRVFNDPRSLAANGSALNKGGPNTKNAKTNVGNANVGVNARNLGANGMPLNQGNAKNNMGNPALPQNRVVNNANKGAPNNNLLSLAPNKKNAGANVGVNARNLAPNGGVMNQGNAKNNNLGVVNVGMMNQANANAKNNNLGAANVGVNARNLAPNNQANNANKGATNNNLISLAPINNKKNVAPNNNFTNNSLNNKAPKNLVNNKAPNTNAAGCNKSGSRVSVKVNVMVGAGPGSKARANVAVNASAGNASAGNASTGNASAGNAKNGSANNLAARNAAANAGNLANAKNANGPAANNVGPRNNAPTNNLAKTFPNLGNHKVLDASNQNYNCISHTLGVNNKWVNPQTGPANAPLAPMDKLYAANGFQRQANLDLRPAANTQKVALYATKKPDGSINKVTHAALQQPNGTWTSKLGSLPLVQHNNAYSVAGRAYGVPVATYTRPIAGNSVGRLPNNVGANANRKR